ncbi:MAG: radical SAM protein, partial [Candidatus Rokubacteria bacterium]|nr:radical SAM protein [Candidatus Rokubacteria bacterium]
MSFGPRSLAADDVLAGARPATRALGLYLHVPFCAYRCHYCAFNTAPLGDAAGTARFVAALRREIDGLGDLPWARDVMIATMFFGGGTPSTLAAGEIAAILDTVRARFTVAAAPEITVECNPESVDRARLEGYRAAGVSRISLGVQALDDAILATLGRRHGAREAADAFAACREAGVDNVSVDVMFGLPGLDLATWTRGVETILGWEPEHVSSYGLSLDPGSLWG